MEMKWIGTGTFLKGKRHHPGTNPLMLLQALQKASVPLNRSKPTCCRCTFGPTDNAVEGEGHRIKDINRTRRRRRIVIELLSENFKSHIEGVAESKRGHIIF